MAETQGIEIFGRGATVVDTSMQPRRGPWLGVLSLLLGVATATVTGLGVVAVAAGDGDRALWFAITGIACGILGALVGFVAVAGSRGVGAGLVGMALSIVGNPWVLSRLLEWVGSVAVASS